LRALENFSQGIGLIPEQIWDAPDLPSRHLRFGGPTDAAVPLLWAHSEYVKLHRSAADGKIFDLIELAYDRYVRRSAARKAIEVWKWKRHVRTAVAGTLLRIQATKPFLLHWTNDEWQNPLDSRSQATGIGVQFVDIPVGLQQMAPIRFTFFWLEEERWEGSDFVVVVEAPRIGLPNSGVGQNEYNADREGASTTA
jgi:glucoamylase